MAVKDVQTNADLERGRKLRAARMAKGLSQRALAALVDDEPSQPIISFYEQGDPRYRFTEDTYKRLMTAIAKAKKPPVNPDSKKRMTEPARVRLMPPLADDWEGLDIARRSKIVEAGYAALGKG